VRVPAALRWTGLALLGIVIAAVVSVAASRLASQQIGLASEPISAGDALAPAQHRHRVVAAQNRRSKSRSSKGPGSAKHRNPPPSPPTQPAIPAAPSTSPPVEEVEPSQASGDGEHRGGGADD
jgi:hypothetical protein